MRVKFVDLIVGHTKMIGNQISKRLNDKYDNNDDPVADDNDDNNDDNNDDDNDDYDDDADEDFDDDDNFKIYLKINSVKGRQNEKGQFYGEGGALLSLSIKASRCLTQHHVSPRPLLLNIYLRYLDKSITYFTMIMTTLHRHNMTLTFLIYILS